MPIEFPQEPTETIPHDDAAFKYALSQFHYWRNIVNTQKELRRFDNNVQRIQADASDRVTTLMVEEINEPAKLSDDLEPVQPSVTVRERKPVAQRGS